MLSERRNISSVADLLVQVGPKSVLDVGVGFGTYGFIARAFLDVWRGRFFKQDWKTKIDGIEACKEFENPVYSFCYDHVFFGDACEVMPELGDYDVVILFHVLEHMDKSKAIEVMRTAHMHAVKRIIIGTPEKFFTTGYKNWPSEQHRCQLTEKELKGYKFNVKNLGGLGLIAWKDL